MLIKIKKRETIFERLKELEDKKIILIHLILL